MRGHSQIIVRAPDGDLFAVYVELGRERRIGSASCDFLEDAIRMVLLLFHDLFHEKSRVLEAFCGAICEVVGEFRTGEKKERESALTWKSRNDELIKPISSLSSGYSKIT